MDWYSRLHTASIWFVQEDELVLWGDELILLFHLLTLRSEKLSMSMVDSNFLVIGNGQVALSIVSGHC